MNSDLLNWSSDSIYLQSSASEVHELALDIYDRTCRTNFDSPGFCVLNAGNSIDSVSFRQLMVDLKREMSARHRSKAENTLVYLSAARFDQQETTKPHLDGGPDECFLMLGYEPSNVDSELEIFDYSKCAYDLGISPQEFMGKYNPMFQTGYEMLIPYSTRIPCFSRTDYQIICINNSSASYSPQNESTWQGVLHTATILTPDESARRVINSTMIASASLGAPEKMSGSQLREFIKTSTVLRRGYDKPHLENDS